MEMRTAIALREWAVTIDALAAGKQILLMRKGGIHEETRHFEVQSDQFYLFPSYEHQKKKWLKPEYQVLVTIDAQPDEVEVKYIAQLHEDIKITEQEDLEKLTDHHIWTNDFALGRFKWKPKSPLHLLLIRVYKLENPFQVTMRPEFRGCRSWLQIPNDSASNEAKPVMSNEAFSNVVDQIKKKLILS